MLLRQFKVQSSSYVHMQHVILVSYCKCVRYVAEYIYGLCSFFSSFFLHEVEKADIFFYTSKMNVIT